MLLQAKSTASAFPFERENEMENTTQKRGFGQRINRWLDEPEGETFKAGKWRFWFLALVSLSILNAILTASIFGSNRQGFIGSITLAMGALVAWLCVGTLHYSDSRDTRLARGVSLLDSVSLCFVIAHFCFLLWAQGHLLTIQAQEAEYKASATAYNEKADKISGDNVKIAEETTKAEKERAKAERLRNDTAYQERKAAEAGHIQRPRVGQKQSGQSPAPSTAPAIAPVELAKPEKPKETSASFLGRWDAWIRAANFGELILAAITLIFIRNRSARFNAERAATTQPKADQGEQSEWPDEIEAGAVEKRSPTRRENFTTKKETQRINDSFDSAQYADGAQALRDALKDISFRLKGYSFKITVKPDSVWIMMVEANQGTQQTVSSARCDLAILDDAQTMPRDKFRAKLERTLKRGGFEI
jgi:hypothetical protein